MSGDNRSAQTGAVGGVTAGRPATTRVTILTGRRLTDLVLPAATPIEAYIDETVAVLAEILEDTPADVLAGFDFGAQGVWAFARPGAPPLKPTESLAEAGVVDGALLTLVSTTRTERFRPLVEDVIDAIALLEEAPEFDRAALLRFVGAAIPVGAAALTLATIITWAKSGHGWWWAVALAVVGMVAFGGYRWAARRYGSESLAESLLVASVPLLAGAAALAVPLPEGNGFLGAPQIAAAAAVVAIVAVVTRGGPKQQAETASFAAVAATAAVLAAVAYGYGWQSWVPAGAVAFGLIVVTNAAKLTVAVARIALPPVPAPGESVSYDDLLDPVSGPSGSEESTSMWQAIIASVPESAARLTERSALAKRLLVGFVAAGSLVLAIGAVAVLQPGHFLVHSLIVVALVATVCAFRSRLYVDRWCAWWLLAASVAVPLGAMLRLCWWFPRTSWLILGCFLLIAVLALVLLGAGEGGRRLSPVTKRSLELVDGTAIAAVIPLLLWIAGLFDVLRNIRF